MKGQHGHQQITDTKGLESKEGEQRCLCCNNIGNCSPSLVYKQSEDLGGLDKAFELLFEEVLRNNQNK